MPNDDDRPLSRPPEAIRGHRPTPRPPVWHRGEEPVMTDGQLGSDLLDRGVDRANPEGTADVSRPVDRPFGGD